MAIDSGQNSFRRGVMSLVILGLLKKQDMYGYQLVQETERQSGGRLAVSCALQAGRPRADFRPEGSGGQANDTCVLSFRACW